MKKELAWIFIILLSITTTYSQIVLKSKEIKERLNLIETKIQNKELERAIALFFSNQEIIYIENVSKKQRDQYTNIKSILDQKKRDFNTTREKVDYYQTLYSSKNYCSAIDLLDLTLNVENSSKETRDIQSNLSPALYMISH